MKNYTVAVTGHRPNKLGGYGDDVSKLLTDFAISQLHTIRPSLVLTGMAIGWDQAVAQACAYLNIPFHAVVPFNGQESMWPEKAKHKYNLLLRQAARVTVVSSGSFTPLKMQKRNEYMVDRCDLLLALWDGSSGGTANCVSYADRKDKAILNIYQAWQDFVIARKK